MTNLTTEARDDVADLLQQHAALCSVEGRLGMKSMTGHNQILYDDVDDDSKDEVLVLDNRVIKTALASQKEIVIAALAKHGIEIE